MSVIRVLLRCADGEYIAVVVGTHVENLTTFEVAATPDSLNEVQDRFAAWWDGLGIDDVRLRFALETALAEVAANIVEHTVRADRGTGRTRDELANVDPWNNAAHAYQVFREQGWRAWSVYLHGTYERHLSVARAGVQVAGIDTTPTPPKPAPPAKGKNWGWLVTDRIFTADSVARRYGLSVTALRDLNGPHLPDPIPAGTAVKVRHGAGPFIP